jgi:hypothetical protein
MARETGRDGTVSCDLWQEGRQGFAEREIVFTPRTQSVIDKGIYFLFL